MFTGIIESLGTVEQIHQENTNMHFWLSCPFTHELQIDQSLSHNGVCLTVIGFENGFYKVSAIEETLKKSNLSEWQPGDFVNLERCMPANGRFDGHIVQGHVDLTAYCVEKTDLNGSWRFTFEYTTDKVFQTVEKGSITVNGVSLTVVDSEEDQFSVHIIPYTYTHTNFHTLHAGSVVNIEFDIIGKYLEKLYKKTLRA